MCRYAMKQVTVLISFICCLFFFASAPASILFAQTATDAASPDPTPVSYELSYPGLLPDNPFYFFKIVRNNIVAFFLGKPIDKANFALLQSDKHVSASKVLITEKNKVDLAHAAFADAQSNFQDAINQAIVAKKQGTDIQEITTKLKQANMKHTEVLDEMTQDLSEDDQAKFVDEKKQSQQLSREVAALKR
jgi:hypothetical protein